MNDPLSLKNPGKSGEFLSSGLSRLYPWKYPKVIFSGVRIVIVKSRFLGGSDIFIQLSYISGLKDESIVLL